MYINTYSMAEAYILAREAELNHAPHNDRLARLTQAGSTKTNGRALDKLGDGLTSMGKLLKSKLAPGC
jgi:hypothetical protein